jgi:hypothetical protein
MLQCIVVLFRHLETFIDVVTCRGDWVRLRSLFSLTSLIRKIKLPENLINPKMGSF